MQAYIKDLFLWKMLEICREISKLVSLNLLWTVLFTEPGKVVLLLAASKRYDLKEVS